MKRIRIYLSALFVTSIISTYVHSADGVLEINQACALNGGCFSGDSGGFPVTIDGSAGVSYRLTSSLDLAAHPTDPAISISASFVTLDLNGFQIAGATDCVIEPVLGTELICTPSNNGAHGIEMVGEVRSVSIKNGTIRKMPDNGISGVSALRTHVENVALSENAGWGALLGDHSHIQGADAEMNGGGGFSVQDDSNISHSQASGNDGNGFGAGDRAIVSFCNGSEGFTGHRAFELGPRSKFSNNTVRGSARCGGGICTEKKRFYLTVSGHEGDDTLNACASGFRMASMFELLDTSNLKYDTILGITYEDSGGGPPSIGEGWIRSGYAPSETINCNGWTELVGTGVSVSLPTPQLWASSATINSPWYTEIDQCTVGNQVWCIEN